MAFKGSKHVSLGLALAATVTAASLWLSYTNKLNVYIGSQYDWFALIMAVLSFIGIAASTLSKKHAHNERQKVSIPVIGLGLIAGALAFTLLMLQPKVLSSATALQRGINAGGLNLATTTNTASFGATNYSQFDIRDWASVLSQATSESFYTGKTANLLGFVSPAPGNDPDVFYASRFYITCCAMDAQPYGVPIYAPNWKQHYPVNSWVSVSGGFIENPHKNSSFPIVVMPTKLSAVPEPADPYER